MTKVLNKKYLILGLILGALLLIIIFASSFAFKTKIENKNFALVIGNEGDGVSKLVKENCDMIATIPMKGDIDSLNASVATGVLAYEIVRQRLGKK